MENYAKSCSTEAPLERQDVPIDCLPENFLWMKVKPGSKLRNILGFASSAFKDQRVILWTGSGSAIIKAISCAEIMKRNFKSLHQITRVCFRKLEETWDPITDGLDQLVVTREVPTIHIMLSKDSLDINQLGYQGPEDKDPSFKQKKQQGVKKKMVHRKGKQVTKDARGTQSEETKEGVLFTNETPLAQHQRSQKRKRNTNGEQKKE
ncbi:ribonuclease P protein subunit p25-like protein [Ischnura elegans]|uniref:ribonuclease P protein subunit p25-like protein n=1 Tax=Ischnura elegans TaxID=197161 RepID=UPI001ED871AB|nr:ribonuclease P protein subunit p25-like protein [Ischnura elegans]